MIGNIGDITFVASESKLRTFQQLTKDYAARYATHEVIGKKPVLEFIGPDIIKANLTIRLESAKGVVVQDEIDAINTIIESGEDQPLFIGKKYFGQFVIKSMNENDSVTDNKGVIRLATITINLEEYADERV